MPPDRFDLATARLNAGLSQRELAAVTGVPRQTIQRLEDGLGAHPANAKKVADYFGIRATDLTPIDREAAA